MNKLIIAALSIVGLIVSSSVFAADETYNEHVKSVVDDQKRNLDKYKPPEAFLKIEISGEAPTEASGADDGASGASPLLGGDDGGYSGGSDEDNTWQ